MDLFGTNHHITSSAHRTSAAQSPHYPHYRHTENHHITSSAHRTSSCTVATLSTLSAHRTFAVKKRTANTTTDDSARFQDPTVSFFYASRVDPSPRRLEPRLGFLRRMQLCSWRPKLRAVVCQATWVDWALEPSCHQASSSCSASSGERLLVVCLYF